MSRIADKHGLTNQYRESGSKRLVKRGRPRKYLLGYRKSKSKKNQNVNHTLVMVVLAIMFVILFIIVVNSIIKTEKPNKTENSISYTILKEPGHPVLYDEYDAVKEYYQEYDNVSVGSYQSHPEVENSVITALSYLDYDRIYLITINTDNEGNNFILNDAIAMAVDYIPVEMVLENFDFEKAIYKIKGDGMKQYECYYTQKKEGVDKPGYYYNGEEWVELQNGLSIIIQEKSGGFIIEIGDDWYALVYDPNPTIGLGPSQEELESHCDWDFRLEEYVESLKQ